MLREANGSGDRQLQSLCLPPRWVPVPVPVPRFPPRLVPVPVPRFPPRLVPVPVPRFPPRLVPVPVPRFPPRLVPVPVPSRFPVPVPVPVSVPVPRLVPSTCSGVFCALRWPPGPVSRSRLGARSSVDGHRILTSRRNRGYRVAPVDMVACAGRSAFVLLPSPRTGPY